MREEQQIVPEKPSSGRPFPAAPSTTTQGSRTTASSLNSSSLRRAFPLMRVHLEGRTILLTSRHWQPGIATRPTHATSEAQSRNGKFRSTPTTTRQPSVLTPDFIALRWVSAEYSLAPCLNIETGEVVGEVVSVAKSPAPSASERPLRTLTISVARRLLPHGQLNRKWEHTISRAGHGGFSIASRIMW